MTFEEWHYDEPRKKSPRPTYLQSKKNFPILNLKRGITVLDNNHEHAGYIYIIKTFLCLCVSPIQGYAKKFSDMWFIGFILPLFSGLLLALLFSFERTSLTPSSPMKVLLISFIGIIISAVQSVAFTGLIYGSGALLKKKFRIFGILSTVNFSYAISVVLLLIALIFHAAASWSVVLVFGITAALFPLVGAAKLCTRELGLKDFQTAGVLTVLGIVVLVSVFVLAYAASR